MDRIPIGGEPKEPDNVVHLPGHEGSDEPADEVSYEEALAADEGIDHDEDDTKQRPPGSQVAEILEQGVRVGAGLFAAGATALADALRSTMPEDESTDAEKDPATTLAGAGLGAAVLAAEATAGAAKQVADTVGPALTWLVEPRFAKEAGEMAAGAGRVLDGRWKASQAEMVQAATSFLHVLVPEIAQALADQVDLTALVRDRVDVNAIVEDVDIDRIIERVDLDAVVERIDVDAIVDRIDLDRLAREFPVEAVVDRVDVNRAADRIDIDRVISRTDLTSIVNRLDLGAIAQEVIEDVDLPGVIRESSGALAGETVRTARIQGMHADRLVARIVDTVLRREARDLVAPQEDDE
ncbi:MAG TPA: hypothetical protein VIC52_05435 [Actinomycetota bacterium]